MGAIARPVRSMIGSDGLEIVPEDFSNPYVTSGLVAMWDAEWNAGFGIHDPFATTWRDLVGRQDISLASSTMAFEWTDDSLVGTGKVGISGPSGLTDSNRSWTMEGVVSLRGILSEVATNTRVYVVSNNSTYGRLFTITPVGTATRLYTGVNYDLSMFGNWESDPDARYSLSGVYSNPTGGTSDADVTTRNYCNGMNLGTYHRYLNLSNRPISMFGNPANKDIELSSEVCNLRLYSRALEPDEVAYNSAIDAERFGTGL